MGGIGIVTNPRSRLNKRYPELTSQLAYVLGEKGDMEQPSDLDALDAAALRFRDRGIDALCVNGGDGTLHRALTAMVKAYAGAPLPKIVLLRGGTMNTIASGLGIRGKPAEILDFVVSRYHADQPMPTARRWLMEIDGKNYGFLFGNGIIARFLEIYYEGGDPTPVKAAWMLLKSAFSAVVGGPLIKRLLTPFTGEVEVDGKRWPANRWMTVAAGTVDDIGLGFRPFWQAPRHPGRMHAIGFSSMNPAGIVKELPRMWMGKQMLGEDFHDRVGERMILRSEEPISYMIDGDFHQGGTEITIRIGPAVDLVIPD